MFTIQNGAAWLAGVLLGCGLWLSGMHDPANVVAFLDLAGEWNPRLACVMLGAIPVASLGFAWVGKHGQTVQGEKVHLPGKNHVTPSLIGGSAVFGVGWALAGFCPGPAILGVALGLPAAGWFCAAMVAGMWVHDRLANYTKQKACFTPSDLSASNQTTHQQ